ncbi:MAG TPA: adenylate/guanylate cyclase domain-containing protein [Nevskiaceae bacterium]|nr:adenylate/guanylate cyclase domain-containing protein [Nevskiaceae bacterium]
MEIPPTRYADGPHGQIAWQSMGEGPLDLVYVGGQVSHLDLSWELPEVQRFRGRLSRFTRLILFDRLGTGISDPAPTGREDAVEQWVEDLEQVIAAAGASKPALFVEPDAGPAVLTWAVRNPDRLHALILVNPIARFTVAPDFPIGAAPEAMEQLVRALADNWGTERLVRLTVPTRANEPAFLRMATRYQRASATPRRAEAHYRHYLATDVRDLLPQIRCPTLLLHRPKLPFFDSGAHARYVESRIPGSQRVEIPGGSLIFALEEADEALGAIEEFLTGRRDLTDADRRLLTVLFTDVVGSTKLAASLGDSAWRDLTLRFHAALEVLVDRFRGRVVDTAGDGLFAVFDSPTRALRCAESLRDEAKGMNLTLRTGLHAGECEASGGTVRGLVVHIGARVAGEAKPGEIWTTSTLRDLVAGSGFGFARRGTFRLKGVDGLRRLYALDTPDADEADADD